MQTLTDLFATFAERGDSPAFIFRTGVRRLTMSYRELHDLALRMNRWLERQGVGKGDRLVLWAPNSPWWGVVFWGCVARGVVVVPVDFMSGQERAETIVSLTGARLIIQSRFKPDRVTGSPGALLEELEFLLAGEPPSPQVDMPHPDDPAQLIYTSGTTGNPKGVILTHNNLMANLRQVNAHVPVVTAGFRFLSLLPLSHMFEQMGGFFTPLSRGSAIVYLRTLKPSAMMEAFACEDIAAAIIVPRLLQLLKSSIERELEGKHLGGVFRWLLAVAEGLSPEARRRLFWPVQRKFGRHFTLFVSGGAPLDPEVFKFWSLLGFTVLEGYGLTECAPVLTANPLEQQVAGSVGKVLPGVELRLERGEVQVRGENVFPGYYQNGEATREAFTADGWFRTGDLGELDPSGNLIIKGRAKELIVTGAGINVYPDEIESILNKAAGVREGCVIGLDRGSGEEVHAVLLLDGSGRPPEEIVAEVNGQLDELHRITGWALWPEAEFPKTTTLKIRKFMVRDRVRAGLGAAGEGAVADRLATLIARVTGASPGEVTEEAFLVANLGLTSIGRLELVNLLEQEYRLDLEETLIGPQTRVGDLRRMVEERRRVEGEGRFRFWTNAPLVRGVRRLADLLLIFPLVKAFVILEVRGVGQLAALPGPFILAANHVSYLDQPVIMRALPARLRYRTATAAWAEFFFVNFRNPPQRLWKWLCYQLGTVALNLFPLPQSAGFRSALAFMGKLADHGISILVFPEGERTLDGNLLPFRQGLGIMVQELRVPVVPVKIVGLERVFPRGAHWPKRGRVTVIFGEPLRFGAEGQEEIVERVRAAVEEL